MKNTKIDQIETAISEARRFIARAEAWKKRIKMQPYVLFGSSEGGAAKRASMDLTRALVDIRRAV